MKQQTKLIIFQVVTVILILILLLSMYTLKTQQNLLNLSSEKIELLEKDKLKLKKDLEYSKSYNQLDAYTSSYSTESFKEVSTDGCSYWFVYYTNQPSDGCEWSNFIKMDYPYFSYDEFKKPISKDKVEITGRFIKSLTRVSKATYDACQNYD